MTGCVFHPDARLDLEEIWEFVSSDNIDAADRTVAEILAAIQATVPFPAQGHKRPDLTSRPLRFLLVREYLIAYAPDERPLWVLAICMDDATPASWPQFSKAESNLGSTWGGSRNPQ